MRKSKIKKVARKGRMFALSVFAFCLLPFAFASGHEVYVLPQEMIDAAMTTPSQNPVLAYFDNKGRFYFWGAVAVIVTLTIFFASTFRHLEARAAPLFAYLKRFAHPLVRITVGGTLVVFAATAQLYGPEIPLDAIFGEFLGLVQIIMLILGVCIMFGFQTRMFASIALLIYLFAASKLGIYAFTYLQHAAAYLFLIIMGGGAWTIDHRFHLGWRFRKQLEQLAPYAFPLLRIGLGVSIMFAAFYAKFLHSNLAMQVVNTYHLDKFFQMDPLFIVLGALIIEFLAGLMLALGFEIRWTALFLVFWLTLAHLYLPEAPWVHLSLYGLGVAVICHGYDRFTIEGRFLKRRHVEPVL